MVETGAMAGAADQAEHGALPGTNSPNPSVVLA